MFLFTLHIVTFKFLQYYSLCLLNIYFSNSIHLDPTLTITLQLPSQMIITLKFPNPIVSLICILPCDYCKVLCEKLAQLWISSYFSDIFTFFSVLAFPLNIFPSRFGLHRLFSHTNSQGCLNHFNKLLLASYRAARSTSLDLTSPGLDFQILPDIFTCRSQN